MHAFTSEKTYLNLLTVAHKFFSKMSSLTLLLGRLGVILLILTAWYLPASYFDQGESVCYFKRHWGVECPGCGLTRGTQHFLHGEWETALDYNPLSFVVGGVLIGLALWQLVRLLQAGKRWLAERGG